MLRRNISPRDILQVCFREWEASLSSRPEIRKEQFIRIKALVDREQSRSLRSRDPVGTYRDIHTILSKGNRS
jgi:hypothetical protein